MEVLAWTAALAGIGLGAVAAFVPGFPGCAVALLGLVAFAGLTDFEVVGPSALALAGLVTVVGAVGQVAAPVATGRAAGGTAGVATGAMLGAIAGALVPLPAAAWLGSVAGAALLGFWWSRGAFTAWLRGVVGTGGGCLYGVVLDLLAVLGVGAVLGLADFLHAVRA
jgi:uncharacterized protein YqgC (DUF456 family)